MAFTPYVKQTWIDNNAGSSPDSAARRNFMEQGIFDAHYKPYCILRSTGPQSIANATIQVVSYAAAFAAETADTDNMHDPVTNPNRITCQTPGLYDFKFWGAFSPSIAGNQRYYTIQSSTGAVLASARVNPQSLSNNWDGIVTVHWPAAAGDWFETRAYQDTGGALNLVSYQFSAALVSY
jgi:hypothetical protein